MMGYQIPPAQKEVLMHTFYLFAILALNLAAASFTHLNSLPSMTHPTESAIAAGETTVAPVALR